jgi:thiol-disulfide isomerase/thioredoxin
MDNKLICAMGVWVALALAGRAPASPVIVTVVDGTTGQGILGAAVGQIGPPRDLTAALTPVGATDAGGTIRLDCDPARSTAFLVTAPGRAPGTFRFFGCVPPSYRVALAESTATFSGQFFDTAGKPIADAPFRICCGDDLLRGLNYFLEGSTDQAGRFAIAAPKSGRGVFVLLLSAGRWRSGTRTGDPGVIFMDQRLRAGTFVGQQGTILVEPPQQSAATTQPASLTIHLRVVDDATGAPLGQVRVTPGASLGPGQFTMVYPESALEVPGAGIDWSFYDGKWEHFLRVESEGYAAAPTRIVKTSEGHADVELRLTRATSVALPVLGPDGKPASGAMAYIATPTIPLIVDPTTRPSDWSAVKPFAVAGVDGVLHFSPPAEPYRLAIFKSDGSAEAAPSLGDRTVRLEAWASVDVTVAPAGNPLAHVFLGSQSAYSMDLECPIDWNSQIYTDGSGHAEIAPVRPGFFILNAMRQRDAPGWLSFELQRKLKPGEHCEMHPLAGKTTVRGMLAQPAGCSWQWLSVEPTGPAANLPGNINSLPKNSRDEIVRSALNGAPRPGSHTASISYLDPSPGDDGLLSITGLPPGTYELRGISTESAGAMPKTWELGWYFVIPDTQPADLDLGTIQVSDDTTMLQTGQVVPDLKATALDGKPFSLKACRGHWVLLDFWGTWCGFCIGEEPGLIDAQEGWGRDGRLIMVSASVGDTIDQVRKHVAEKQLNWTQLVLGPRDQTSVPQTFCVEGYPDIMLISPEGKLVENDLRGAHLRDVLVEHLGPASPPAAPGGK